MDTGLTRFNPHRRAGISAAGGRRSAPAFSTFRAPLMSRSCNVPHSSHLHCLTPSAPNPFGLLAGMHRQTERVWERYRSGTTRITPPVAIDLYGQTSPLAVATVLCGRRPISLRGLAALRNRGSTLPPRSRGRSFRACENLVSKWETKWGETLRALTRSERLELGASFSGWGLYSGTLPGRPPRRAGCGFFRELAGAVSGGIGFSKHLNRGSEGLGRTLRSGSRSRPSTSRTASSKVILRPIISASHEFGRAPTVRIPRRTSRPALACCACFVTPARAEPLRPEHAPSKRSPTRTAPPFITSQLPVGRQ
jgi:hypothetical protein